MKSEKQGWRVTKAEGLDGIQAGGGVRNAVEHGTPARSITPSVVPSSGEEGLGVVAIQGVMQPAQGIRFAGF